MHSVIIDFVLVNGLEPSSTDNAKIALVQNAIRSKFADDPTVKPGGSYPSITGPNSIGLDVDSKHTVATKLIPLLRHLKLIDEVQIYFDDEIIHPQ